MIQTEIFQKPNKQALNFPKIQLPEVFGKQNFEI